MNSDTYKQLPIVPPPQTIAIQSNTFRPPPLDGSITVPEMYDWHLKNSPDHPIFVYSDEDGATSTIKIEEAVKAMHRAGRRIQRAMSYDRAVVSTVPFLAILANTGTQHRFFTDFLALISSPDTITFYTTMVGAMRVGLAPFPISPRNSPAAVAHLITKVNAPYMLVGPESNLQDLAAQAFEILKQSNTVLPHMATMPVFEDLYEQDSSAPFEPLPPLKFDMDDPVVVMHSSGV